MSDEWNAKLIGPVAEVSAMIRIDRPINPIPTSANEMSSSDTNHNSVTRWLDELKDGSDDAASQLWSRYFEKLVAVARKRLANSPKRVSDEEDVAINVFNSLCAGVEQGKFDRPMIEKISGNYWL